MSFARSSAAVAVTAFSFFAATQEAHAATGTGTTSAGQSYAKSISKDDFGAGFQVYARASATDYAQRCEFAKSAMNCGSWPSNLVSVCNTIQRSFAASLCQQKTGQGFVAAGSAGADVTLFGKDFDLFDISASADAEPASMTAGYGIYVLGQKIKGEQANATLSKNVSLGERTLVSATSTFMLGPIPLTVEASATGNLGIEFSMSAGTSTVTGTARPYVSVDGTFSAGVGVSGFSGGVTGDLLLVELSTPATAALTWQGGKSFAYDASLDLEIKSLDGSVGLYGQVGPWRKTWTIFSWDGLTYDHNLGETHGNFTL